jgi:hypothetical protein
MNSLIKPLGWAAVLGVFAVYVAFTFTGPRGLPALQTKWRQIESMQRENATIAGDNAQRRERVRLLQESQEEQMLRARERLKKRRMGTVDLYYPGLPSRAGGQ